jgi:putative addiction module killer protein
MRVIEGEEFVRWFQRLRDPIGSAAIIRRIVRLRADNFGDAKSVGGEVTELRIDVGPGYRLYLTRIGTTIVVLLCGGDKRSQAQDIRIAQKLARDWKERLR